MSSHQERVLADFIDQRPLSGMQVLVVVLCGLIATLDGFDVQAIAFAAPAITHAWGAAREEVGMVFSAGLIGMLIGVLMQGPIADRIGRKPVIVLSVLLFGGFTLGAAFSTSIEQLLILRLVAGVGMGAAVPNFISLTGEYSPARLRARMIVAMNAGFPLGGFLGGLLSAQLLTSYGWHAIFLVGGIIPLLLLPALVFWLPESVVFLAARRAGQGRLDDDEVLSRLLTRLTGGSERPRFEDAEAPQAPVGKVGYKGLFTGGRAGGTALLWGAFFASQFLFYFLMSWLPSTLADAGLSQQKAVIATATLNLGSIIGGFCLGWVSDRVGTGRTLAWNYMLAGSGCVLLGFFVHAGAIAVTAIVAALGFFVGGGVLALNALAAAYYPTIIRSTGLGAAALVGRSGAIVAPMIGGVLIGSGLAVSSMFMWLVVPATLAAASAAGVGRKQKLESTQPVQTIP